MVAMSELNEYFIDVGSPTKRVEPWVCALSLAHETFITIEDAEKLASLTYGHTIGQLRQLLSQGAFSAWNVNWSRLQALRRNYLLVRRIFIKVRLLFVRSNGFNEERFTPYGVDRLLMGGIYASNLRETQDKAPDTTSFAWFKEVIDFALKAFQRDSVDPMKVSLTDEVIYKTAAAFVHEYLRKQHGRIGDNTLLQKYRLVRVHEESSWIVNVHAEQDGLLLDIATCTIAGAEQLCERVHGTTLHQVSQLSRRVLQQNLTRYLIVHAATRAMSKTLYSAAVMEPCIDLVCFMDSDFGSSSSHDARLDTFAGVALRHFLNNTPDGIQLWEGQSNSSLEDVPELLAEIYARHFLASFVEQCRFAAILSEWAEGREIYLVSPELDQIDGDWPQIIEVAVGVCGFKVVSREGDYMEGCQRYGRIVYR